MDTPNTFISNRSYQGTLGLQNAGMASGIAAELKKVATLGLAPIVFGPVMNITASTIANWWRTNPVDEHIGDTDREPQLASYAPQDSNTIETSEDS